MDNDKGQVAFMSTSTGNIKEQSLQDKTGATAKQIRKAIEQLGFDRDKVEQYLLNNTKPTD